MNTSGQPFKCSKSNKAPSVVCREGMVLFGLLRDRTRAELSMMGGGTRRDKGFDIGCLRNIVWFFKTDLTPALHVLRAFAWPSMRYSDGQAKTPEFIITSSQLGAVFRHLTEVRLKTWATQLPEMSDPNFWPLRCGGFWSDIPVGELAGVLDVSLRLTYNAASVKRDDRTHVESNETNGGCVALVIKEFEEDGILLLDKLFDSGTGLRKPSCYTLQSGPGASGSRLERVSGRIT